ncbi:MAG TPA: DUF1015 family protein [Cytophagaceae bacterium]|jgi:uncharacterized protein (DUF1015 family)
MTQILPFKAYRYTAKAGNLSDLVISQGDSTRNKPGNSYSLEHLIKSPEPQALFEKWKENEIISQDPINNIYTFRQECIFEGKTVIKKGFICKIELSLENTATILEHEHVIEEGVRYHLNALESSQLTIHPVMGMYSDDKFQLERFVEVSLQSPIASVTNDTGGKDTFSAISDIDTIAHFKGLIANKKIFLADGHHRYHAALKYANRAASPKSRVSTIMYLSNMEDANFHIFPYHRIYNGIESFCEDRFIHFLQKYFEIEVLKESGLLPKKIKMTEFSLGLIFKSKAMLLTLKEAKKALLFKTLDMGRHQINFSIIQNKLLLKGLKISSHTAAFQVEYEPSFRKCYKEVQATRAQLAVISPGITSSQLKIIAEKKIVLPEKTTFFYPKAVSGIVLNPISENADFL